MDYGWCPAEMIHLSLPEFARSSQPNGASRYGLGGVFAVLLVVGGKDGTCLSLQMHFVHAHKAVAFWGHWQVYLISFGHPAALLLAFATSATTSHKTNNISPNASASSTSSTTTGTIAALAPAAEPAVPVLEHKSPQHHHHPQQQCHQQHDEQKR